MKILLLKSGGIWFLFIIIAIINGLLREEILSPLLGPSISLPLSGLLLSTFILLITYAALPFLKASIKNVYWIIGGFWLILTLAFEFLFGRYILNDTWEKLFAAFDVSTGNPWLLVVLVTVSAPWLTARLRGY